MPAFGTSSSRPRLHVLHDQATQKEQEVEQLTSKIENLKQSLALAQKTLNIMNSMEEGVVSQVDKLKAQRDVHDLKSELEVTQLQLPQAKSAQQEAENRVRGAGIDVPLGGRDRAQQTASRTSQRRPAAQERTRTR